MPNPTRQWDKLPVFGWWQSSPGVPAVGNIIFTVPDRIRRNDGRMVYPGGARIQLAIGNTSQQDAAARAEVHDALKARDEALEGVGFDPTAWEVEWDAALPSAVFSYFYLTDDPDITPNGWQVKVDESLTGGAGKTYYIETLSTLLAGAVPGINLGDIEVPPGTPSAPLPIYAKGQPGGVAALDVDGDVVDSAGTKVTGADLTSYATQVAALADYPDVVLGADARLADQRTPTDSSVTNAKVAAGAAIDLDKTADSVTRVAMAATERTKLTGVATGATANSTDAQLRDRATHTGSQAQSTVTDLTTDLAAKAPLASPAFTGTPTGITKTHVGLGNVDNTADSAKPVSTAQGIAIDAKADTTAMTTALAAKITFVDADAIGASGRILFANTSTPTGLQAGDFVIVVPA